MWDLLLHDPMYVGLMVLGMSIHSSTPAWLLVPIAFGLAVVAVAVLEVAINEFCIGALVTSVPEDFPLVQRNPLSQDKVAWNFFERETYYDARLYLDPGVDVEQVIETLKKPLFARADHPHQAL